jgi:hypothetical protein
MSRQHRPIKPGTRRRSVTIIAMVTAALLLASAGCSSKSSTAKAAAAPSASAKSDGCVAGAYKDPHGVYCVLVPDGYKPPTSTQTVGDHSVDQFETDDGFNFSIEYWAADTNGGKLEDMKDGWKQDIANSDLKLVASADLPGGGLYEKTHSDKFTQDGMKSVIKFGNKVITCDAEYNAGAVLTPADACKSLRGM